MTTRSKPRTPGTNQRGEDSRQRIIEAALEIFGRHGYEAATTRQLARSANVNIAAIAYYFGGKEGLYRAVAEHIIAVIATRQAPMIEKAGSALADPGLSRNDALALLLQILDSLADMIIGAEGADRWARFVMREQMDPTPAFDILYEGFLGRMHRTVSTLIARAIDAEPGSPEVLIRASTIIGQVMVFRAARAAIQRRLGWDDFGPDRIAAIKGIVRAHVSACLAPTAAPS